MKAFIDRFASLRVTVTLLVVLLVALAAGTIVESLRGAEAALRAVYRAPWFYALLAVFALNLACSLVSLWPWGSRRIGYATTHLSMLVILAGALATELGKTEGQLHVWEGEEATTVIGRPASPEAEPPVVATLPFAVRLDAFEIDYYEGTRRPAQFRSRVTAPGRGTGHAGGDLDEPRARLRRVHVLPEQLPGDARPRPDDPVRLEGPGRADRLPRVLRPRGGHDHRPRHAHPRAAPRAPAGRGGDASRPARRGARRGAGGPTPAVPRRRRGAPPSPGPARRPGHAPRHPRARGGLERHREAQRVGSRPDGHGSRAGSSTPGPGSSSRSWP